MKVLHVLSQRPSMTGSGVTLDALARQAAAVGWEQEVVVGVPRGEPTPAVGGIEPRRVRTLAFGEAPLDFPVPGMSDVMPYSSTRFAEMTPRQLSDYRDAWLGCLASAIEEFRPDLVHAHHVWIVGSLIKDVAPQVPVVTQCHATGLRQMRLCPHLADAVRKGCARNDRFLALHAGDADAVARELGVPRGRVHVVGAGYRNEIFHARGRSPLPESLAYVGKYSAAKGLPWLLDAVERLASARPALRLHVVGSGSGSEAEALRSRMAAMAPLVELHGTLPQERLAELLRRCRAFVLPSLYEGVPLVVVEALACGCRPVVTDLPGVRDELAPRLGESLIRIPPPRLATVDTPVPADLPAFVEALSSALRRALDEPLALPLVGSALEPFTWSAVFQRVEAVWRDLYPGRPSCGPATCTSRPSGSSK